MLDSIEKPLHDIVGPKDDFRRVVSEVVDNARRLGWLQQLIGGALKDAGGNAKLQKFIKDYPEYNPTPTKEGVINGGYAIAKTQEMLKDDLIVFRSDFQKILKKIDIFKGYKVLHDKLHEMSVSIFPEITREAANLPDGAAKNNLVGIDMRFRAMINDMRAAMSHEKDEMDEMEEESEWAEFLEQKQWVEELDLKRRDLKAAVKDYDKDLVRDNLQGIENVLEQQPTEINRQLLKSIYAENDRLPELIKIMNGVCERMKQIESEAANVPRFEKGMTSLKSLTSKLKSLVKEHDTWQEVEGRLQQIGEWLEVDLKKFSKNWEPIRTKVKPYYSGTTEAEEWMTDFQQDDKALEDALRRGTEEGATAETVAAARADAISSFQAYRDKAKWRFFDVDKLLLNQCKTLSEIREDLP